MKTKTDMAIVLLATTAMLYFVFSIAGASFDFHDWNDLTRSLFTALTLCTWAGVAVSFTI